MKKVVKTLLYYIMVVIIMWIAISSLVQAAKCPSMSQTELFLRIPQSFVGDWQNCE